VRKEEGGVVDGEGAILRNDRPEENAQERADVKARCARGEGDDTTARQTGRWTGQTRYSRVRNLVERLGYLGGIGDRRIATAMAKKEQRKVNENLSRCSLWMEYICS
jgi:hypothetical protein